VDNAASGENDGTSWTDAWESFDDIVWGEGGVVAGDELQLSGGAVSKTYTGEELTVGASGSSGSVITIRNGTDSGHDGQVIIDGNETAVNGINLAGRSYITVKNIRVIKCNALIRAGHIHMWSASNIILDGCEVLDIYCGNDAIAGWNVQNITITNCKVTNSSGDTALTEDVGQSLIYLNNGSNCIVENCFLGNYSNFAGVEAHNDSILMQRIDGGRISNCYMENTSSKTEDTQGIWIAYPSGTWYIYNNICYSPNSSGIVLSFRNSSGTDGDPDTFGVGYILNNTVIGSGVWNTFWLDGTDCIVKNNAFWGLGGSAFSQYYRQAVTTKSNVDYNRYYYQTSYTWPFSHPSGPYTWAQWQALGYDPHSGYGNIKISVPGSDGIYTIAHDSPLIEAGEDLGSLNILTTDYRGNPRGTGSWTVGALEYDTLPPNEFRATQVMVRR
jgi:hypothetical protein